MAAARKITVELSSEAAELVDRKLQAGEFTTESEVIAEGLQVLRERDMDFEAWLREEVVPTYEAHLADPSRAIPIDDVFGGLEERYRQRKSRRE